MEANISVSHGEVHHVTEQSIPSLFDHISQCFPDRNAVIFEGSSLTFRQLSCRVNQICRGLPHALGKTEQEITAQDVKIALYMPPGDKRISTLLAILKLKAAYVPLDSVLPVERMRYILNECKPICIITSDETCVQTEEISVDIPMITYESVLALSDDSMCDAVGNIENKKTARGLDVDPLICVLYTSGSTGTPKGCQIRTSNLLNRLSWQWACFPFRENEVGCHKTSILFIDSLTEILSCLLQGVPIVIASRQTVENVQNLVQLMKSYRVTRVVVVPSLLRAILTILKLTNSHLPEILVTICSGDILSPKLAHEFFNVFPKDNMLLNFYGSTETTGDVSYDVFKNHDDVNTWTKEGKLSIGQPIWNCSVYLLDDTGNIVPVGTTGDIYISGCNVTEGYVDKLENTVFLLNNYSKDPNHSIMYKMGDMGKMVHGRIIYQGRKENFVKIRGYRVNTLEVENTLKKILEMETLVVLGCQKPDETTILVMFYTMLPGRHISEEDIIQKSKEHLPEYMVPSFMQLDEIPLQTQTGKVDRQAMEALFAKRLEKARYSRGYQGKSIPEKVYLLISEELGFPRSALSLEKDFFSAGGNSITAISMLVKFKQNGLNLSVNDLLTTKNIKEIADVITKNHTGSSRDLRELIGKYNIQPISKVVNQDSAKAVLAKCISESILDVLAGATETGAHQVVESIWDPVLEDNLSFVVENTSGNIVSVVILLDARTKFQPKFEKESVLEILNAVQSSDKCRLLDQGGKWINYFFMGVDSSVPVDEKIWILQSVEEEVLRVASNKGYDGIMTVNAHPVTADYDEHFRNYEVHSVKHVRTFEYNGEYPFHNADDDFSIKSMVKWIK